MAQPSLSPSRGPLVALVAIYLLTIVMTRAWFQGDTIDYATETATFDRHGWDFGHLWWVPLGLCLQSIFGIRGQIGAIWIFFVLVHLAGLVCVVCLYGWLRRIGVDARRAGLTTAAFLFAHAMLNYTQTGSSYVPGLTAMLAALGLLCPEPGRREWPFLAGCALAAAICLWFPFVLIVPGVLLAPLILRGFEKARVLALGCAAFAALVVCGLAYGVAMAELGIHDMAGLRAWVARSSHGIQIGGATRMAFGLARSLFFMGDDGLLFKRYLLHDSYNPVSLRELIGASLWKLALFYLAMVVMLVQLLASAPGRRVLLLLLIGSGPVIAFGLFWQGGDMERYLPLYPFLFAALAAAMCPQQGWWVGRCFLLVFALVIVLVNGFSLSRWQVGSRHERLAHRAESLREVWTEGSRAFVVRDRLHQLPRDFPLDTTSRGLKIEECVTPGLVETPRWRSDFAARALRTWRHGGEVWLSCRLLADKPSPDSTWVEGDDNRLRWEDVPAFFRDFEVDSAVGGEDGFVRLVDSPGNRQVLHRSAQAGR